MTTDTKKRLAVPAVAGLLVLAALLAAPLRLPDHAPAASSLPAGWVFQATRPAKGEAAPDAGGGVRVHVTAPGRSFWQAQLFQDSVALADGHRYAVSFEARAGRAGTDLPASSTQAARPWGWTGMAGHAKLGTDWRAFKYVFTARGTAAGGNKGRLSRCPAFGVGNKAGDYWIRRVSVMEMIH